MLTSICRQHAKNYLLVIPLHCALQSPYNHTCLPCSAVSRTVLCVQIISTSNWHELMDSVFNLRSRWSTLFFIIWYVRKKNFRCRAEGEESSYARGKTLTAVVLQHDVCDGGDEGFFLVISLITKWSFCAAALLPQTSSSSA